MIAPRVLGHLRNGVCAVAYLTEPLAKYIKNPEIDERF